MPSRIEARRLCTQLGLVTALAAAVVLGFALGGPPTARAGGELDCWQEGECTFKRPNLLFVLEYSTAMNQWDVALEQTRWDAAVELISSVAAPGSFLSDNAHLALLRFGHDPDPNLAGTTITGDTSGLVDGVALDLEWDDERHVFQICNGQQLLDTLAATPAPLDGLPAGIGAWTKGALERAAEEIAQTQADHPEDQGERRSAVIMVGSGRWTSADGQTEFGPPADDPVAVASMLLEQGVETHVSALTDDPQAEAAAEALAIAGGTSGTVEDADALVEQVAGWIQTELIDVIGFEEACPNGHPRVMILLDASSSMLNVDGGASFGAMGETPWDQVREAIGGWDFSVFAAEHESGFQYGEFTHFGIAVFGDELPVPGEHKLLSQYNRCLEAAFEWALDPATACEAPGCTDPWGGPPITWAFKDSTIELPEYPVTYNHMPACQGAGACQGSGSFVHLGLELVAQNQADYHLAGLAPDSQYYVSEGTQYLNILITDGGYAGYSTDAQVQAALEGMFAAGVITHVIGFGELAQTPEALAQLDAMASWGSGGALDHHAAPSVAELELALAQILATLELGPCCPDLFCNNSCGPWADCSPSTEGEGEGDGDGDGGGDGDGDGHGDGDPSETETSDPGQTELGDQGESETADTSGETASPDDEWGSCVSCEQPSDCNCTSAPSKPTGLALLLLLTGFALRRRLDR